MSDRKRYSDLGTVGDFEDALTVLSATGMATRCPGQRIILSGYICLHCGADPSLDECKKPKPGFGKKRRARLAMAKNGSRYNDLYV